MEVAPPVQAPPPSCLFQMFSFDDCHRRSLPSSSFPHFSSRPQCKQPAAATIVSAFHSADSKKKLYVRKRDSSLASSFSLFAF